MLVALPERVQACRAGAKELDAVTRHARLEIAYIEVAVSVRVLAVRGLHDDDEMAGA